jgi:translation initiation factor IF-2
VNEYKANPNRLGMGIVIESNIDKGFGPVATVLVKNGSLTKGDFVIAGSAYGHIRAMFDENGKQVLIAYPSQPVKITGLNEAPAAGDHFVVNTNEKDIKEIAKKIKMNADIVQRKLETQAIVEEGDGTKHVYLILKTDVHGSLEAIRGMINKINVEGAKLHLIRSSIGGISESDIQLAKASKAVVVGFNIKPSRNIKEIADNQKIKILFYDVIYRLNEDLQKILLGSLDPEYIEQEMGEAVIQQL